MIAIPSLHRGISAAAAVLLSVGSGVGVVAQSVTTTPVGAMKVTLSGASSGSVRITTFSPTMRLSVAGAFVGRSIGAITDVTSSTLTDSSAGWSSGALSQVSAPYFVKMVSGSAVGAMWQVSTSIANTSTSISLISIHGIDPVNAGVKVGDRYELIPADTLDTFFSSIEAQIGGVNASASDIVRIHDGSVWREYYYNSANSQWREGSSSFNKSNIVLRPNSGIIYMRKGASDLDFIMIGNVCSVAEKYAFPSTGATFLAGAYPVDRELSDLNVNLTPGFVSNTGSLSDSDKVRFFDGSVWRVYNYNSAASQWREGSSSFNKNKVKVPAGVPVIIERGVGTFRNAALYSSSLPYVIN